MGDDLVEGETIVINAGGRPREVSIPGIDDVDWLNNARLLGLPALPQHLVIVGGSYISLEFAQAFRRLGSEITILEGSPQLMVREDADIAEAAQKVLEGEGITIHLNAKVERLAQESEQKIDVTFEQDGESKRVRGTHLLLAVGRVPNSDRLNLEAAGVEVSERGYIVVNDVMQTSVPHIFAVGDVNGEGAFTHTSVNDGEIFWDYYCEDDDRVLGQRIPTYAMFVDPPPGQ